MYELNLIGFGYSISYNCVKNKNSDKNQKNSYKNSNVKQTYTDSICFFKASKREL